MKRRYLLSIMLVGLLCNACSSDRSEKTTDTVVLDSPAVSDSLDIRATDADSTTKNDVPLDTLKK